MRWATVKHRFIFWCFLLLLNIFLDILFIVPFHMGVAGAAWATILSQFLSALFSLLVGLQKLPGTAFTPRRFS